MAMPSLLWANLFCLLDRTSGAAMSVRTMLRELVAEGWDVRILGATQFDHPDAAQVLPLEISRSRGAMISIVDDGLVHELLVTQGVRREDMTAGEEAAWYGTYIARLESFQPDFVFFFGGQPFDHLIADEAKSRGICTVFYLANGNYTGRRWARDVDLVLTDTQATSDLYRSRLGMEVVPVGKFIIPGNVVAADGTHDHLLFVNPTLGKGAFWVALLAEELEQTRPDIRFEIVEARNHWAEIEAGLAALRRTRRRELGNVTVTPNTMDMRPVYGRARLVIAPSLWWESGARVLAEAMLNGIPAITTDHGGAREMIGEGGYLVRLPAKYHQAPFTLLPSRDEVRQLGGLVEEVWSNPDLYQRLAHAAFRQGREVHDMRRSRARLVVALSSRLSALSVSR